MAFNLDLDALKTNLFDAAKSVTKNHLEDFIDESSAEYQNYLRELKEYTDNLAVLKKEIVEADSTDVKEAKEMSIRLQQRAINSMVDRYKMLFQQSALEKVKEVLYAVATTVGKIALSVIAAAV